MMFIKALESSDEKFIWLNVDCIKEIYLFPKVKYSETTKYKTLGYRVRCAIKGGGTHAISKSFKTRKEATQEAKLIVSCLCMTEYMKDKDCMIDRFRGESSNVRKNSMQLKPCKFKTTPAQQYRKIQDEAKELLAAIQKYTAGQNVLGNKILEILNKQNMQFLHHHMGEECCDVMVACLTFLHQHFNDDEINELFNFVNEKNRRRGYLD